MAHTTTTTTNVYSPNNSHKNNSTHNNNDNDNDNGNEERTGTERVSSGGGQQPNSQGMTLRTPAQRKQRVEYDPSDQQQQRQLRKRGSREEDDGDDDGDSAAAAAAAKKKQKTEPAQSQPPAQQVLLTTASGEPRLTRPRTAPTHPTAAQAAQAAAAAAAAAVAAAQQPQLVQPTLPPSDGAGTRCMAKELYKAALDMTSTRGARARTYTTLPPPLTAAWTSLLNVLVMEAVSAARRSKIDGTSQTHSEHDRALAIVLLAPRMPVGAG